MLKSSVCARTYTTKQQRREYRQQQQQNTYNKQRTAAQDLCIGGNSLALALCRERIAPHSNRCVVFVRDLAVPRRFSCTLSSVCSVRVSSSMLQANQVRVMCRNIFGYIELQ